MRKLYSVNTSSTPTFDAKNATKAHVRVVPNPNPAHSHIRHYG